MRLGDSAARLRPEGLGQGDRPMIGEYLFERDRSTVGSTQRDTPVGVFVGGAGLILGALVTDRVGERQSEQSRRCAAQILVQGQHGLLLVGVFRQQADSAQLGQPRGPLGLGGRQLLVDRTCQQSQRIPQAHMLIGQITGSRRQVVRGHRRQAVFAPPLGRQRAAGSVAVEFEPQNRGTQYATRAQIVADPRLDRAEIFADHQRRRAIRLQRDDADHRLVAVAHIRALGRRLALRNPPQPEQADDVVDPHAAGVPQHAADQGAKRPILQLVEPIRTPRRLRPVLPQLVELVRRRTG